MVGGLGEEADAHHERDRVGERRPLERLLDLVTGPRPTGERGERRGELGARRASACAPFRPLFNSRRPAWATLARCRSTCPTPKPRPMSSSTVTPGLTLHWADGTASHFGLDELRRNCPCAECRGPAGAGTHRGPESPVAAEAHRARRRARRRLGPHHHTGATATAPASSPGASCAPGRPRRLRNPATDAASDQALTRSLHRKRWCTSARTTCPGWGRAK